MNPGSQLHHDGSGLYVSNSAPALGDLVAVRLRVPAELQLDLVQIRSLEDAEPRRHDAVVSSMDGIDRWYTAQLPIRNPLARYRWYVRGPELGWGWLTAAGWYPHDVPDAFDFSIAAAPPTPSWAATAVAYQVFPDRFAASGRQYTLPEWAVPRPWHERPEPRRRNPGFEYFGGDLWGLLEHLDHLQDLGVTLLYLTPFYPANTTHRYDATSFQHVDPLLGGDEALVALVEAAHGRGLRVMGDLTLNHSGRHHEWFLRAQAGDPGFRDFYMFDPALPHGYECWWGFPSLPKFNWRSEGLREQMITGETSVVRRWLRPPYALDGWRIDVANMMARNGDLDLNREVARLVRRTVEEEGPDKLLIAEHFHDAGDDLDGRSWHGTMNYVAFRGPVVSWLAAPDSALAIDRVDGNQMVAALRMAAGRMPWRSLAGSWNLLGSHDTARARSVFGDRQTAAATLLVTLPGTPMVFAGDEFGATGDWGEDGRVTMPWDDAEARDMRTMADYRALLALRRSHSALAGGGLRWVHVGADLVSFLRETVDERVLVVVARAAGTWSVDVGRFGITELIQEFGLPVALQGGRLSIDWASPGAGIWSVR